MTSQPADAQLATASPAVHKLCRACKFAMPLDANKCTNCDSLQNWRRYLDALLGTDDASFKKKGPGLIDRAPLPPLVRTQFAGT
jgi:ribosomal protein L40E